MKGDDLILRPRKMRGEDGYKTFSIRIKSETVDKISRLAQQTGYSRNELIGRFLEYAIERCKVIEDPPQGEV